MRQLPQATRENLNNPGVADEPGAASKGVAGLRKKPIRRRCVSKRVVTRAAVNAGVSTGIPLPADELDVVDEPTVVVSNGVPQSIKTDCRGTPPIIERDRTEW